MNDSYCDSDDGIQAPTIVIQPRIRQFVADELLLLAVFTGAMAGYAAFEKETLTPDKLFASLEAIGL